ncbi:MAG: DUF4290 domain-containing protein [Lewinellaceae bacterium]|nr:DUF4290 domain-containing protein [Lewinellaceae bacterium]
MKIDIEYNTEREIIKFPEYGRSIQEMLQYAKTIEDRDKRQKTIESIIGLMMTLNPSGNRNLEDYKEKLWDHAFAIADYDLDVTPPPGIVLRRQEERPKAEPVGYPATATRFRHYGNGIQALMRKAIEMPDGPKKEGFVEVIASYMKLAYKTWNREHYVSDDIVKEDLEILSDGQLVLHEGHDSLDKLAAGAGKHDKDRRQQNQRNRGKQQNNGGGRNRKRANYGNNYRKRKK